MEKCVYCGGTVDGADGGDYEDSHGSCDRTRRFREDSGLCVFCGEPRTGAGGGSGAHHVGCASPNTYAGYGDPRGQALPRPRSQP